MVVVAGGMIRSGSTFAFNIVRELLLRSGAVRTHSANGLPDSDLTRSAGDHVLIKTHLPDPNMLRLIAEGRLPCVCTVRRPEDAISSWSRAFAFSLDHGIEQVERWHGWHRQVRTKVLTIDYEVIDGHPKRAIESIIDYLGIEADSRCVDQLESKYDKRSLKMRLDALVNDDSVIDVGFSYYDRETFFHRRHIASDPAHWADVEWSADQHERIKLMLGRG